MVVSNNFKISLCDNIDLFLHNSEFKKVRTPLPVRRMIPDAKRTSNKCYF